MFSLISNTSPNEYKPIIISDGMVSLRQNSIEKSIHCKIAPWMDTDNGFTPVVLGSSTLYNYEELGVYV
jgi:hypothetical protein